MTTTAKPTLTVDMAHVVLDLIEAADQTAMRQRKPWRDYDGDLCDEDFYTQTLIDLRDIALRIVSKGE